MNDNNAGLLHPAASEPGWLRLIASLSSSLNRIAAGLAAVLLVLMVGLILVEIVLRFFSRSTFMADALVGHGVAAITFLAVGWALEQGSMIRVSVVTSRLGAVAGFVAETFSVVLAEILVLGLMVYQWRTVAKLWNRGSTTEHYLPIPLWIPEAIFFAGLSLLALQLLVRFCRLMATGRAADARLRI